MRKAFVNNEFIAEEKAVIGINDLAVRRGFGIFDFFRTVGANPLFLDEHLERFYLSAEKVSLKINLSKNELKQVIQRLIDENKMVDSGVRLILTGGYSPNSYTPSEPNLLITNERIKVVDESLRKTGIKVISTNYQREFPEVKTINYFTGVMMQSKAHAAGAFEVLYYDKDQVRECTRSNIFAVFDTGKIKTPDKNILMGVTRKKVIELARKKYEVEEGPLSVEDLLNAREVFITGTTKRVLPVIQIDDHLIGDGKPGKITMDIFDGFYELEKVLALGQPAE